MIWTTLIAGVLYLIIISLFLFGWEKIKAYSPIPQQFHSVISVIIPMRNEEINIKRLLLDLLKQNYPSKLIEVIVIDDHSTDNSLSEVRTLFSENILLFSLPESLTGKKAALTLGIENAHGDIILTTDADCRVPEFWLSTIACYFDDYSPSLLLSPVCGISNSFFGDMQALEIYSLQGSTAGAAAIQHAIMSNGANLAFPKNIYHEFRYLYEESKIQSGDDIFLLHELKRNYPNGIHYLKSKQAAVFTKLSSNPGSFFRQRKRWTSKAKFYTDTDTIVTAVIVFGMNVALFSTIIYGIFLGKFFPFLVLFITKSIIDFIFLLRVTSFFGQKRLMWWFPIVQSFYFLYVCLTVFSAFFTSNSWKERSI